MVLLKASSGQHLLVYLELLGRPGMEDVGGSIRFQGWWRKEVSWVSSSLSEFALGEGGACVWVRKAWDCLLVTAALTGGESVFHLYRDQQAL